MFPDKWCVEGEISDTLIDFFNSIIEGRDYAQQNMNGNKFHYPPVFNGYYSGVITSLDTFSGYTLIDHNTAHIIVELMKQDKI